MSEPREDRPLGLTDRLWVWREEHPSLGLAITLVLTVLIAASVILVLVVVIGSTCLNFLHRPLAQCL